MWFMKKKETAKPTMAAQLSLNPDLAWSKLESKQTFQDPLIHVGKMKTPGNTQRFVCVSDTHGRHHGVALPRGDILLHCGDFTDTGQAKQVFHENNNFAIFNSIVNFFVLLM